MAGHRERRAFRLGLDPAAYNPIGLRPYSDAELLQEYRRIYAEARDRLRGFERSSEFRGSNVYQMNKNKFKRPGDVAGRRELERLVQYGARFVTAKGSSVSGQRAIRRAAIETLHEHGYTFVNTKNYDDFVDFLQWLRESGLEWAFYGEAAEDTTQTGFAGLAMKDPRVIRAKKRLETATARGDAEKTAKAAERLRTANMQAMFDLWRE